MNMEIRPQITGSASITAEERRLIDEAVNSGRVEKIPQGKSSTYPDYIWDPKAKSQGINGALVARNPQDWNRKRLPKRSNPRAAELLSEIERLSKANLSKAQISRALKISSNTVSKYRRKLINAGRLEPISSSPKPCAAVEARREQALKLFQEGQSITQVAEALGEARGSIRADRKLLEGRGLIEPKKLVHGVWI